MPLRHILLLTLAGACLLNGAVAQTLPSLSTSGSELSCMAPSAGNPCADSGPATLALDTGAPASVGNPIHLASGNKYQQEVDMAALPGELGLEVVRHYNSSLRHVLGLTGAGWRLSYETDLYVVGQKVQIVQADGSRLSFSPDPTDPGSCQGQQPAWGRVDIRQGRQGPEYTWHWTHGQSAGRRLHFNTQGRLIEIQSATGAVVVLRRGPRGELLSVTDPQGRRLTLRYRSTPADSGPVFGGVMAIDTPTGSILYTHGPEPRDSADNEGRPQLANLRRVHWPARVGTADRVREYHYEDLQHPQALTGISEQGDEGDGGFQSRRLSTYRYNVAGLAVYSENRGHQVSLLQLQRARPGRDGHTLVQDEHGRQSLYRHRWIAGEYRLTEAYGSGCDSCAPVNRRWSYDAAGRLVRTTLLRPVVLHNGQAPSPPVALAVWTHLLDDQGRLQELRLSRAGRVPTTPVLWWRLAYEDPRWPDKPTRIERPSVVTGQRYQRQLQYNAVGLLEQINETGYAPSAPGASPSAVPALVRTFRWHYEAVNGHWRWTGWDGPLPNGPLATPADSDIIRLHWDQTRGTLQQIQRPGEPGRPANETDLQTLAAALHARWWQGLWTFPAHTAATSPLRTQHLQDDFGRPVLSLTANRGTVQRGYDLADRLVYMRDGAGHQAYYQHDLRHRIVQQDVHDADTGDVQTTRWVYAGNQLLEVQSPGQSERFAHDAQGRLSLHQVMLPDQDRNLLAHIQSGYDTHGRLAHRTLPDGSLLRWVYRDDSSLQSVHLNPVRTPWLRWLAREQLLVSDIQQAHGRLVHWRLGNGVQAWLQRDAQGRPWHLRHQSTASPRPWPVLDQYLGWSPAGHLAWRWQREAGPGPQGQLDSHAYDHRHRLLATVRSAGQPDQRWQETQVWRYAYDAHDRRLLAQTTTTQNERRSGTQRLLHATGTHHRMVPGHSAANSRYSSNGQPLELGRRQFEWDALGRLTSLTWDDGSGPGVARYRYDHRGLRNRKQVGDTTTHYLYDSHRQPLAEVSHNRQVRRQYVFLGAMPLAVLDGDRPLADDNVSWTGVLQDLHLALRSWWRPAHQVHWLHTNHLGAPEAATNASGQVVWRARYQPDGAAEVQPLGPYPWSVELRWPGQYHDTESGLHYHRQRYYDPALGQFLTPDPLGWPDGPNPYAYVAYNPWRFVDPDGLLLFAFDGTGNDETVPAELSNVVKFRELYDDGDAFYITGPGTLDPRTGIVNPWYKGGNPLDAAFSFTGKQRVLRLLNDLVQAADGTDDLTTLQVDVVGFSRGAAEARDFVNQVADALNGDWYQYRNDAGALRCQKLNLRFVGLWDTVLSTHTGDYRLAIPSAVDHAAHALALNEYRSLFPAESILNGPYSPRPVPGQQRVEQGLLGSHSDVGGSFPDGELAQAALAWMVQQAVAAGVRMDTELLDTLARPALHDKSSNLTSSSGPAPSPGSEDRVLRYQGGSSIRQRQATVPGMSHDDTLAFIDYEPAPRTAVAGWVDMSAYLAWRDAQGLSIELALR